MVNQSDNRFYLASGNYSKARCKNVSIEKAGNQAGKGGY